MAVRTFEPYSKAIVVDLLILDDVSVCYFLTVIAGVTFEFHCYLHCLSFSSSGGLLIHFSQMSHLPIISSTIRVKSSTSISNSFPHHSHLRFSVRRFISSPLCCGKWEADIYTTKRDIRRLIVIFCHRLYS